MTMPGDNLPRIPMKDLETKRLRLRPVKADDATTLYDLIYGDANVRKYYCPYIETLEATQQWLYRYLADQKESRPDNYHWLICRIEDDCPVGAVGLEYTLYEDFEGEGMLLKENAVIDFSAMLVGLHYAVGTKFQRLGYGTEAAAEIVGYAFTFPEINRIVNVIDAENEDSDKLMRRLKFTLTPAPHNIIGILESSSVKPSTSVEAESV